MVNNNQPNVLNVQDLQDLLTQNSVNTVQNTVNDIRQIFTDMQTPNLGLYRNEPRTFYGKTNENFEEWIRLFERFARVHSLSDDRKISLLPTFLGGLALNFFNQKESENLNAPLNFNQWKQLLNNEFPVGRDSALKEIGKAVVISDLVKAAYPTLGADQREIIGKGAFLRGLKPSIKRFTIIGVEPTNLDEAIRRAMQQEIQEQTCSNSIALNMASSPSEIDQMRIQIEKLTKEMQMLKTHRAPTNYNTFPPRNTSYWPGQRNVSNGNYNKNGNNRCFKCGKIGHHAVVCRNNYQQHQNKSLGYHRSSTTPVARGKPVLALMNEESCKSSNEFPIQASKGHVGIGTTCPAVDDDYFDTNQASYDKYVHCIMQEKSELEIGVEGCNVKHIAPKCSNTWNSSKGGAFGSMNILFFVTILLLSHVNVEANLNKTYYQCSNTLAGFLIALPNEVHCTPPIVNEVGQNITVEVWTPRDEPYLADAVHCRLINKTICTYMSVFGGKGITKSYVKSSAITPSDCSLAWKEKTWKGEKLQQSKHFWTSESIITPKYEWCCRETCTTKEYLLLDVGQVGTINGGAMISDLADVGGCHIISGQCVSRDSVLVWNPTPFKNTCQYKTLGKTYEAKLSFPYLIIDELQIGLTIFQAFTSCSLLYSFLTRQGILIRVPFRSDFELVIRHWKSKPTDIEVSTNKVLDPENPKLQYLLDKVEHIEKTNFREVWLEMCRAVQRQLMIIKQIVTIDPTLDAKIMLHRQDIKAATLEKYL